MSLEGRLADISVAELLQFVHLGARSGTLHIRDAIGDRAGSVSVHQGRTVGASCPSALPLGELLVQERLLTAGQLATAQARQAVVRPRPLLDAVLAELKLVTPEKTLAAVEEQIKSSIYELLTWTEGTFMFEVGRVETLAELSPAPGESVPPFNINTQGVLLEGLQRIDERAHAASAGLEAPAEDTGAARRQARPTVPVALIDPASPWLRSVLQIVSRDVELARKVSHKLAGERIRSVRLGARDAGAAGPDEDPPAVLLDLRAGAATANDLRSIRAAHPRALLLVLPGPDVAPGPLYAAGASAVLPPDGDLVAACAASLVRTLRDSSRDEAVEKGVSEGFARVHRLFQELRSGSMSSTFALNLMGVVSESAERAVLLVVRRKELGAMGAFGNGVDGRPLAEATKALRIPREGAGALLDGGRNARTRALPFDERALPTALASLLGPPRTGQCLIVPVPGGQGPIAVLYADNGASVRGVGRLDAIELAAAHVGLAFENHLLRRHLGARADAAGGEELVA
jgi:hypothetical protein